jgi:general transcription factor 3C polypeptide 3 (transcription factor C subunit 4)
MASRYPYHVGVWTLCRLLDGRSTGKGERGGLGDSGSFSTGFRKAMVRYQSLHMDSLPLLMLVGSECLLTRQFRYAVGVYCEAYRLAPEEPLTSLCIAVSFLSQVMSRVTTHRHGEMLRGLSFLCNYRRLREKQAAAAAAAGAGAPSPALSLPLALPLHVVTCEGLFNMGRACHALGLLHLAVHAYQEALHAWDGQEAGLLGAGVGVAVDVRREAAYNLCLLLKAGGAAGRAQAITARYLSYD